MSIGGPHEDGSCSRGSRSVPTGQGCSAAGLASRLTPRPALFVAVLLVAARLLARSA